MGVSLPRWVWVGAVALSSIAGMVNMVGLLGFEHQAVSHLTGTTTLLAQAVAGHDLRAAGHLAGLVVAFCLGATASGLVIQDATLRLGRRYGVALALEAALLLAAIPLFKQQQIWGALLAAAACGMQNALTTTYSGAIVRTTHLSGMFTDLGIGMGHLLRGMPVQHRRMWLSLLIVGGFFAGAVVGTWLFSRWGYDALLVPAALTGSTGIAYTIYAQAHRLR